MPKCDLGQSVVPVPMVAKAAMSLGQGDHWTASGVGSRCHDNILIRVSNRCVTLSYDESETRAVEASTDSGGVERASLSAPNAARRSSNALRKISLQAWSVGERVTPCWLNAPVMNTTPEPAHPHLKLYALVGLVNIFRRRLDWVKTDVVCTGGQAQQQRQRKTLPCDGFSKKLLPLAKIHRAFRATGRPDHRKNNLGFRQ